MPRGVPANGRRQPSALSTPDEGFETAEAVEAEDVQDRELWTADVEAAEAEPAGSVNISDVPDVELTPEQAEIKRLRDMLARETGRKDPGVTPGELKNPGDGKNIVIHILEDGMTALGKIWYRGEEMEFEPGGMAFKDTFNKRGESWLDLRNDEFAQAERWGKILFRNGPWPGKSYADGTYETLRDLAQDGHLKPPSQAELDSAEKARRKRAAPHLPRGI